MSNLISARFVGKKDGKVQHISELLGNRPNRNALCSVWTFSWDIVSNREIGDRRPCKKCWERAGRKGWVDPL